MSRISLKTYKKCFKTNDNNSHLGFEYDGKHYFISHSRSGGGMRIPEDKVEFKYRDDKPIYIKKCNRIPVLVNERSDTFICSAFVYNFVTELKNKKQKKVCQ